MRYYLFILLLLSAVSNGAAQNINGVVLNSDDGTALANVAVYNRATGKYIYSNADGNFSTQAKTGDTLMFIIPSHKVFLYILKPLAKDEQMVVLLNRVTNQLKEVEVLSPYAKYSRDSAFMQQAYHKTFDDEKKKIEVNLSNGLVFKNLPSELANVISGRRKKLKRFTRTYNAMQSEKYVGIKYNADFVKSVMNTPDDSVAAFMHAYPMEEAYARTASDLELKMWVRSNYKIWSNRYKR